MSILLERAIDKLYTIKDDIIDKIEQGNITKIEEITRETFKGAYADNTLVYNAKTAEEELLEEYDLTVLLEEINELSMKGMWDNMHTELLHVIMCENELIEYMEDLYTHIRTDNNNKDNLIKLVKLIAGDI
ncbi:MAG: hypothetical protein QP733_02745 [Dialister micraerophilus]|uniref:hypothetical protein n=1 Tax=Dialister micraerophilus TaxID=309120 RepID=UPI00254FF8C5|nr:hypothetical protein [Dialister micraerophilus]MDK8253357.1 hypothetical protein [Dialister micraerophilus]